MEKQLYLIKISFIFLLILNQSCSSRKYDIVLERKIYSEHAKIVPSFIPLYPGAIVPKGWIKDWAESAAKGITGHLDEYSHTFGEAWKGHGFEAMGANPDGTGWPLEQASYWLDGAVRLAYILEDSILINKVSKRLDYVVNGVLNGGESFIYWKNNKGVLIDTTSSIYNENRDPTSFNNWAHSQMGRALVAYYQATHRKRILEALVKVYKRFPIGDLWPDFSDVSGACNIDPMIDTYLMSGDKTILDSILSFSHRPSYKSVVDRWLKGYLAPGHNVIYYEDIRVPALLYNWTGNKADLNASLEAIKWGEKKYLLPVGILSGEEWHAGIGSTRNIETCDIEASEWTFLSMLRITGDKSYADRIEKIFFNAAAAPVDREFKTMSYYQSLNRYSSSLPTVEPRAPGKGSYKYTRTGCKVLCCVGNMNRIIPNYVMNMWMASMDGGLAATLYGPCKLRTKVAEGVSVNIDCHTFYPFEESISMTVNPEKDVEFPIYLRIPEWCQYAKIKVNGKAIDIQQKGKEFIKIYRLWKKNDQITLDFPMNVEIIKGKETPYPQIRYFNKGRMIAKDTTIKNPYESVYYGPLLFSLPIPDHDPNREVRNAKFNYALDVNDNNAENEVEIIHMIMPIKWNWSLDAPIQLRIKAKVFDWKPTENQPLPNEPIKSKISTKINLVPYGCTKFRVTMFPFADDSS
jgi:uncharacterized protein